MTIQETYYPIARQELLTPECQTANAQLIAAAPDLLEAAIALVQLADNMQRYESLNLRDALWWRSRAMVAALAKAKGL